MALRPYVTVKLDQERRLRFNTEAIISAEESLGKPIGQIIGQFQSGFIGMKETRILLWAGLLHEMPGLTLKETSELIDAADFGPMVLQIVSALDSALASKDEPKNAKGPGKAGIGKGPSN